MRRIVSRFGRRARRALSGPVATVSLLLGVAGGAEAQLFEPPVVYDGGGGQGLGAVEIADVTGDGAPDVVTLGAGPRGPFLFPRFVRVFVNSGQGAFGAPATYELPEDDRTGSMSVGDLDGDGDVDVLHHAHGGAAILWNDGTGGFPQQTTVVVGAGDVFASAISDLTADGIPDVVISDRGLERLIVLVGTGGGAFAAPAYAPAPFPGPVAVADMDADGHADVVTAELPSTGSPRVRILLGDGTGALVPGGTALLPSHALALAIGDLNGDAWPEVVTPNGAGNSVSVFRNLLGSLERTYTSLPIANPTSLLMADVTGDGQLDAVAGTTSTEVAVLLGNGNPSLEAPRAYPAGIRGHLVAVGDLNGDGSPDVATGSYSGVNLAVLLHAPALQVDAGPDVFAAGITGASVTLRAVVRSQHTGVSFRWWLGGMQLGTGATLDVELPIGIHEVFLDAVAPDGAYASDALTVTVAPPFASQSSLDELHFKVDGLGLPAQQAAVDELLQQVGGQRLRIEALVGFVQAQLDATVGSRASSEELAAAVAELKAVGLPQESIDAIAAAVRDVVLEVQGDLLRVAIETALARDDEVVLFTLPTAYGGRLELVREIVAEAIALYPAPPHSRRRAQRELARGDAALARGEHRAAYGRFADAYRALTRSGRRH